LNLEQLNPQQRKAVEITGGPILIFAGAGSGKTRVLTHKIAYLVKEVGLSPDNILAVTFTNKAANEMKQRVQELLNMDVSSMSVGTFHSISARILRREIQLLGYSNNFVIYDQDDSRTLVKTVIKDLQLDEKSFVPKAMQAHISKAKNQMISPELMANTVHGFLDEKNSEIYSQYQKALKTNNALDFDDLLLKPIELFREHPERLEYYQNKYQYILVDEYQDTNKPQFEFIQSLSREHRDVCVVGDDDQSIYSWRGADVNNILNFSDTFGEAHIINLEQNYRSTKTILECAWLVVSKNTTRAKKKLWTDNKQGEKLSLIECRDERDESWKILKIIRDETVYGKFGFDDLVILYRTNAQSRAVEDVLRREGVPYEIVGGVKFYARKEVKDVLAYLRLIINPTDGVSFDRVVNFPIRGIGKTSIEKIHSHAKENDLSYLQVLDDLGKLTIGAKQQKSLHEFSQLIHKFRNSYKEQNAANLTRDLLLEIDLQNYYENQNTQEALDRWGNVKELLNSITDFQDNRDERGLREFLEEVSLLTDIDKWNKSDKTVTLMTIHSAKGLEFPVVMIVGLEEGLFPLGPQSYEIEELEEERRLFYVAMTRAMKKVYLSYAITRRRFGGAPMPTTQSRFISELPEELVQEEIGQIKPTFSKNFTQPSSYQKIPSSSSKLQKGDHVAHKLFGNGKILDVEGEGESAKLTIIFSGNVRKKLIAKYANLSPLKVSSY